MAQPVELLVVVVDGRMKASPLRCPAGVRVEQSHGTTLDEHCVDREVGGPVEHLSVGTIRHSHLDELTRSNLIVT
jgi:hypothetical protein